MTVHIKLYNGKEDRFREIKESLAAEMGYEPTNPEVIGMLMGRYPDGKDPPRATPRMRSS